MKEWIVETISSLGYFGIGFLMFLENLFPPIPSELIMPLAGFTASQGKLTMAGAITAGVIGTVLGAYPWYYVGKLFGEERLSQWIDRHGKWLGIQGAEIDKSSKWFQKHGIAAVFFGRLVPGIRTLISIPAGFSAIPLLPFTLLSTAGTLAWVSLLAYAGSFLGENYAAVEAYIDPIARVVKVLLIVLGVGIAVWLGLRFWRQRSGSAK
jgi:membrane protein DedA with SNARE-associated domain